MVTVYITTNADKAIENINQSVEGAARFAYGLGISKLNDEPCDFHAMLDHFEKNAAATLSTDQGVTYRLERHFVAA